LTIAMNSNLVDSIYEFVGDIMIEEGRPDDALQMYNKCKV